MNSASRVLRYPSRVAAILLLIFFLPAISAAQRPVARQHWVGTWGASPQNPPSDASKPASPDAGFDNQTVRMIVRVSVGGTEVRVQFSNAFGAAALKIGNAHIALAGNHAATLPGTDRALTFSGQPSFTVPPGAAALSDPVHLDFPPLASLAISVFVPHATGPDTWHALGNQTTYISGPGDFCASDVFPVAKKTESWYWLSGVEVLASDRTSAVITLGDSITDGANSTPNSNHRWPDFLADRLEARSGGAPLAVLNEGISGNRILHDEAGPSALARFDRDVLAQDGARYLIVLEGINDIGWPNMSGGEYASQAVSADDIIAALRQIVERAHAHGLRVFGATLTPFGGAFYETPDGEAQREAVNQWIRTSGAFDGVIDFDKLARDPSHPQQFLPAYDSGDHLHPGDAGYKAMGREAAQVILAAISGNRPRRARPHVHAGVH